MDNPDAYREQFRRHIAAVAGHRPDDGHSSRGFASCPHPDCIEMHKITLEEVRKNLENTIAIISKSLFDARETITACQAENSRLVVLNRELERVLAENGIKISYKLTEA